MFSVIDVVVFGAIVLIVLSLTYAFSPGSLHVTERLARLWRVPGHKRTGFKQSQRELIDGIVSGIGKMLPSQKAENSEAGPRLVQAGFRRPEAEAIYNAVRVVMIAGFVGVVYFTGFYKNDPILLLLLAAVLGYVLPDIWLRRTVKARQQRLRLALPDALDLLVICLEAGLGLDQSILYVSQELKIAHPELCEELNLLTAEVNVGKTRVEALRSLATRTGVEDIQSLVATLIQTDRFGTSVAFALRIHSDDLRTRRRQRAEELAAKTTVKLVFPLVLFVFPATFVVVLGPAVITMIHTLANLH
jgi:tight adherence protein C